MIKSYFHRNDSTSDLKQPVEPPSSLEKFLKRSWPLLAGGAVLILVVCGFLYNYAVSGKARKETDQPPPDPQTQTTTTVSTVAARALDGMPVSPEEAKLQPYAVMVENSPDARPLMGPADANLVVEAPVEGGITRFMLVFDATSTASQIGPVRSARPYYVELATALNAVYAHVGGSQEALDDIHAATGFRDLDQFSNGKSFWRSTKRSAPHNVFTSMDDLRAADGAKGWSDGSVTSWRYLSPTDATGTGDVKEIDIPYGGVFDVTWTYDKDTNGYARLQDGATQRDADGTAVTSTNVVILLTDSQVLDDVGRLKVRTTGSGKAWLFRDGKRFDITWRRLAGSWFTFEATDGNDALFRPGKTWISIVTSASMAPAPKAE